MPAIDYRQARAQVRLAEVLQLLGYEPRRRGPCPLHGSHTPRSRSFANDFARDLWYCFRCRRGGNALDLWVAATGQPLHAAVVDVHERLGRALPWLERRVTPGPAARLKES